MIRVAVCDDHMDTAAITCEHLARRFEGTEMECEIVRSEELLERIDNMVFHYDIVILDMHYTGISLDGVQLGKMINDRYPFCQIIYCVDDYDCIPRVYEVEHCFLFRKRAVEIWLDKAMEKAVHRCREQDGDHFIEFMYERKPVILSQSAIRYIERMQRVVIFHTEEKRYQIYESVKELSERLSGDFVRCQGGFIVNLKYIVRVDSTGIVMDNGDRLPIGKTYKESFMKAYRTYCSSK